MEGDSYPPPSEMEVGNVAHESMPVKSMVDYSDSTSADVHHQEHHGGERQDEMDHQDTPSFSNGNGNGDADEEQSKEMDDNDAPPQEPEKDSFDVFGKMLSSMPAKAEEEEAKNEDEKKEDADEKNEDSEDKKDTFDKMFESEKPADDNDDKKDTFEKMFESDNKPEENEEKKDDQDEDAKPSEGTTDFTPNKFGDRITLLEQSEDNLEYSLPYGWKKIGHRRTGDQDRWDFYIITPDGKKLRSNPEIDRYLEKNPDVDCDREVTNTSRPWADSAAPAKTPAKRPAAQAKTQSQIDENNYLKENISEAFKTLEVYQKALETERARVKKTIEEGMSPDTAVSITRKLRKLYAVTQKNMDLLDRAIVESFVENFPTESTRIHMGRVAPAQPQYAPPVKRGAAKNKKKIKQKIKVKPKGKGKKAPAKGKKKGVIELNGAPDYVEYDLPKSVGKKKRKGYAESDVECIDVSEDDEYYNPKKRSRPGPASSKKGKPGPASKKRSSYY